MLSYEASAQVVASVDAVWQVLSDVEAWPTWPATMSTVQGPESPALRLGAVFDIRQPRLRPATWVVAALDPPRHFQWVSRSAGLCVQADHVVQVCGPAACRLLLRIGFAGLLAPLADRLGRALTQAYLQQEFASFKVRVESRCR
jgi:hypothetical protein